MSDIYDHYQNYYHRWEPLAEFNFNLLENITFEKRKYIYCLCSRVHLRDEVYCVDRQRVTVSDAEVLRNSYSQDTEDQSHVHFSLDTPCKVKCENESASCYCSASHTENYCSTDEHDQAHYTSNTIQPSDSGADLTYQDYHSDITNHDKIDVSDNMDQDLDMQDETNENYFSEDTWDKFWSINRERLIWASWIKKYSDYINPSYLDENNDLVLDENNVPKQQSADPLSMELTESETAKDECVRERKFSYDSKVNPYKKVKTDELDKVDKSSESTFSKEEAWLPLSRRRSCSEHERIVSPRTFVGTDSMTNVTKMTLSSHDVTSSHMTSESTSTDEYSVSSSPSDDQSNDQTRIANLNVDDIQDQSEEMDTEQYWEFLWKKHFGEQYALHYANYTACHDSNNVVDMAINSVEIEPEKNAIDVELDRSESNSQEIASVIEVQQKVDKIKLEDKNVTPKKNEKQGRKYVGSIGILLQNLLKVNRDSDLDEVFEANEGYSKNNTQVVGENATETNTNSSIELHLHPTNNPQQGSSDNGDNDPPEEKPVVLKSSHEIEEEDKAVAEKIKSTFEIMGFAIDAGSIPKGKLVYKKRLGKLRPPRYKKFLTPKKTYFDDDGNPYTEQESQEDKEIFTDEDLDVQSDNDKSSTHNVMEVSDNNDDEEKQVKLDEAEDPLPVKADNSFSDIQDDDKGPDDVASCSDQTKRRKRQKRHVKSDTREVMSDIPPELQGDRKMVKYWKKRHSLFHRFDEGIILDRESWFSVTPESVAAHIADKFAFNTVVDAFCGAGGNTIQFAKTCKKVIAIDIDPAKIEMARHNALVYGVQDNIEFVVGDFFHLAANLQADMVFLSPPWGGPNYSQNQKYDIEKMLEPKPASELLEAARKITSNIALYLPRNTKSDQILELARSMGASVEIEQSYLDRRYVAITAYFY